MLEFKTDKYIVKYIDHTLNSTLECPSSCYYVDEDCRYKNELSTDNSSTVQATIVKVIIKNIAKDAICFRSSYFHLVDSLGFTNKAVSFCDNYFTDKRIPTSDFTLPPSTQSYAYFIFPKLDKGADIHRILSYDGFNKTYHSLIINDNQEGANNDQYIDFILTLKEKVDTLTNENSILKKELVEKSGVVTKRIDDLIKYRTEEDDDYLYLFSDEKDHTISFNREFNKKKENFNWVSIGDPLITMRLDNVYMYMNCHTKIESPISGIFEYEKNKLIPYRSLICKIRKYTQSEKDNVISDLKKKDIRESVYKKELTKNIQREVLDELISEGLVFNSYVDKFGNRSKIAYDVANAVWNRDGGVCVYCNCNQNLEFDHIIPLSKGGATTYRNLQLLCEKCNREKSSNIG